jgi:hypothetical protein
MMTDEHLNGADARLEELAACARQPVEFGLGSHGGPVLKLRRLPASAIDHLAQDPGWVGLPTLAEHAEAVRSDPLEGVPLKGLLRLMWLETRAGLRDAWRRLWAALKAGPPL